MGLKEKAHPRPFKTLPNTRMSDNEKTVSMASTLLQLRTSFLQPPNSNKLDSAQLGHFNPVPTRRPRRYISFNCKVKPAVNASPPPAAAPASLTREPHKYFDQAVITVLAGDGGRGAVLSVPGGGKADEKEKEKDKAGKDWKRGAYKRDFDGSVILPLGGKGGDVILYADEGRDTLLEFHGRSGRYCAKRGGNVDAVRVLNPQLRDGVDGGDLCIGVPLGTVVKRKNGKLFADLANLGDKVLVARGGHGGISLLKVPPHRRKKSMTLTTNVMRDESDKALVLGQPGEEVSLELILRVVADVGLVGLPNAGKSTLLAAITRAKPDIADYPFTTLMPNLGRLDGDPTLGAGRYSSEATLADLPGLIEGAHLGKGLGRNFLRHLRRTRLLVHVVDAAAEDPVNDYRTVKEELRMYNPNYLDRPYIVVLNKIDLPKAIERITYLTEKIQQIGKERGSLGPKKTSNGGAELDNRDVDIPSAKASDIRRDKEIEDYPGPLAVVAVSVLNGIQVGEMLQAIRTALRTYPEFTVT